MASGPTGSVESLTGPTGSIESGITGALESVVQQLQPAPPYTILITKFDKLLENSTVTVGFNVTTTNGKSLFIDKNIPLPSSESGVTDSQIIDMVWQQLKTTIQEWIDQNTQSISPVGRMYIPPIA